MKNTVKIVCHFMSLLAISIKTTPKEDKLSLIQFLFDVAYADKILEVSEERLIRRITRPDKN